MPLSRACMGRAAAPSNPQLTDHYNHSSLQIASIGDNIPDWEIDMGNDQ